MKKKHHKARTGTKQKARARAAPRKSRGSEKLRALVRTQELNELLERSTIESEALQYSGDDRPVSEEHILTLLQGRSKAQIKAAKSAGRSKRARKGRR